MKKLFFVVFLFFQTCSGPAPEPPAPNPGFRVITEIEVSVGVPGFNDWIPVLAAGTVIQGGFRGQLAGQAPYTGTVDSFLSTSDGFGKFDVNAGKAAATWYITAVSHWGGCEGQSRFFDVHPGGTLSLLCSHHGAINIPINPSGLNHNDSAIELQAFVDGINTSNGMPVFQFEDHTGQVIARTTATSVNGADIRLSSSVLMDKPIGSYTVKIYNAPGSYSDPNYPVAYSSIAVQPYCPGSHHCPIGKVWNSDFCYCEDE